MASLYASTVNYDLTYILANINNAVIAIIMEKFLSLKQHLTDQYSTVKCQM